MTAAVEIKLTDETVLATLRDVVAKRPDYVYSPPEHMTDDIGSCFYVHRDEDGSLVSAGCAIGVVLNQLGIPLEQLTQYESRPAYQVLSKFAPDLSKSAKDRLNAMQEYQDESKTWGTSYAMAMGETI
ncbi:hypothetical protein [Streptomyces sp. NPDC047525]|uniref:hypothetical protein n=1 Tax=Streptomyces sp. NPDC047525 TaxID=3155264 RepID=UPI0033D64E31